MVRASSKSSTGTGNRRKVKPSSDTAETKTDTAMASAETQANDSATQPVAEDTPAITTPDPDPAQEAAAAISDETTQPADIEDATVIEDAIVTPPPAPAPQAAPQQRAGIVPLVLGGLVAAGIGYGAAYMGWLPTGQRADAADPALAAALAEQGAALSAMQDQIAALSASVTQAPSPAAAPAGVDLDLSPVIDQIAALSGQIGASTDGIATLAARVGALENRPVFTGNADEDLLAAQQAADARAAELAAERDAIAAEAAAAQEAAAQAAAQAAEAEAAATTAIAEAEAAAQAALARAAAEAALGQVQAALASGSGFAAPLATIAATVTIPEALQALAETGVATQDTLTRSFAPLARAALPVALQETAGDSVGDRLGAFVMGQIGGRAVAPREGDDPDAVLSRVGAAVSGGDLEGAIAEIAALPEGARAVLAPWVADVEARRAAEAGLASLTAALAANGN
ncbi:COG4223 family protein [Roseicyclus sp.]|uniref:COG4223 family protein n=1 Tax=Roseicyclus sp. TaxID=1914329 RepID=UPI003F6CF2BE